MWWLTHARRARATQNVLFSSAPHASTGRRASSGSRRAPGTNPRERRRGNTCRWCALHHARHRIVGTGVDRAFVHEERIRDCGQALACVRVLVGDRLVGDVAARHHQRHRVAEITEQQVVQRRVCQHQAEIRGARGDALGDRRIRPARHEHDRSRQILQQRGLVLVDVREPLRGREVGNHQRERPLLAMLARAQRAHRRHVVGSAREVVAAKALDGDDCARCEQPRGTSDGISAPIAGTA